MRSKPTSLIPSAALLALCAVALLARPAAAEEVIYGPDGAPTVVQRKLYPITGKWEVGLRFGAALNTALVDHLGGMLSVSYHANEWLDLGVDAMGNFTRLSGLTDQIRDKLPARADATTQRANTGDEIGNADQLQFAGAFVARLAPVYGKLDFASEFKVHLQAFVLLGVGGGLVKHESVNLCNVAGRTACAAGTFQQSTSFAPAGEVGGGFRFYLGPAWSLELAVRAFLFPAKLKEANDLTNPSSGTDKTYLGLVSMFNVGFARMF